MGENAKESRRRAGKEAMTEGIAQDSVKGSASREPRSSVGQVMRLTIPIVSRIWNPEGTEVNIIEADAPKKTLTYYSALRDELLKEDLGVLQR